MRAQNGPESISKKTSFLKTISFWRRTVQVVAFAGLLYGGFLVTGSGGTGTAEALGKANAVYWVPKDPAVVDAFLPSAVCKFNPRGGTFAACPVYFLNDKLTWLVPLRYLLGYVLIFFVLGLLLSRLWCGWLCPLGSIEDAVNWVRKKAGLPRVQWGERTRKVLQWTKYSLLGLSVLISGVIAIPALKDFQCYFFIPYCQLCPGRILFPLFGGVIPKVSDFTAIPAGVFTVLAWSFLAFFILGSFLGRRIWCRLCPIGACHEFFNRGGLVSLRKDTVKCNRCGVCADVCPIEHRGVYEEKDPVKGKTGPLRSADVSHRDCILCLRCVELCPRDGCLELRFAGKRIVKSSFKETRA